MYAWIMWPYVGVGLCRHTYLDPFVNIIDILVFHILWLPTVKLAIQKINQCPNQLHFKYCISVHLKNRRAQACCGCRSLAFHFRPTSGSFLVHLGSIDGHIMCPIIQFFKKFRKICGHTYGHTERNVTSKDHFREYTRGLKNVIL